MSLWAYRARDNGLNRVYAWESYVLSIHHLTTTTNMHDLELHLPIWRRKSYNCTLGLLTECGKANQRPLGDAVWPFGGHVCWQWRRGGPVLYILHAVVVFPGELLIHDFTQHWLQPFPIMVTHCRGQQTNWRLVSVSCFWSADQALVARKKGKKRIVVIIMREVISIHIGQAGVQMGNACWYVLSLIWPSIFSFIIESSWNFL